MRGLMPLLSMKVCRYADMTAIERGSMRNRVIGSLLNSTRMTMMPMAFSVARMINGMFLSVYSLSHRYWVSRVTVFSIRSGNVV